MSGGFYVAQKLLALIVHIKICTISSAAYFFLQNQKGFMKEEMKK